MQKLEKKLDSLNEDDILILAGSIPASLSQDTYERLLARLQGRGVRAVVDATRDLLVNVLQYHPFLIKPNNCLLYTSPRQWAAQCPATISTGLPSDSSISYLSGRCAIGTHLSLIHICQDDINAMDEMVKKYLDGAEVVYGVRSRRDTDTFFKIGRAHV